MPGKKLIIICIGTLLGFLILFSSNNYDLDKLNNSPYPENVTSEDVLPAEKVNTYLLKLESSMQNFNFTQSFITYDSPLHRLNKNEEASMRLIDQNKNLE